MSKEQIIVKGQLPGGDYQPLQLDSAGNVKTSSSATGTANVQISDGTQTATITNVAGKKSLDVNVTDITLSHTNDSVAIGDGTTTVGVTTGGALKVDGSAVTQPISGTVGVSGYVATKVNNSYASQFVTASASGIALAGTNVNEYTELHFSLTNTFVATIQIECSLDNVNFYPVKSFNEDGVGSYSLTAVGNYWCKLTGIYYRVNCTSYTSGTFWFTGMPKTLPSRIPGSDDLIVTGPAGQAATVNNILTGTSSATQCLKYRSVSVQITSTATAGTIIFEASNDGVTFSSIAVADASTAGTAAPISQYTPANSTRIWQAPVNFQYFRVRISVTLTGGTVQAIAKFSMTPYTALSNVVQQNTASALQTTSTLAVAAAASSSPVGSVSLGNSTGKTVIGKTGSFTTTATTADQVVLTYTVTAAKTFYLTYLALEARLTTLSSTISILGAVSLETPSGTKIITTNLVNSSTAGCDRWFMDFPEPIPIAAGVVIRVVCTPAAATSMLWQANFGGYEK